MNLNDLAQSDRTYAIAMPVSDFRLFRSLSIGLPCYAFFIAAQQLTGAGFAILEQSTRGLGNAFAGSTALGTDASTLYYNPAALTRLPSAQVQSGLHIIKPRAAFRNQDSRSGNQPTQGPDADGGHVALVPNFYYAQPVAENWSAGIGLFAPFGLVTDYPDDWVGRYVALRSDLLTLHLNPGVAYQLNEQLSFGLGVSLAYAHAELSNALDLGLPLGQPNALDGKLTLEGEDWSYGWNAGLLWQPHKTLRMGLAYRSEVRHCLEGDARFDLPTLPAAAAPLTAPLVDQEIAGDLILPESFGLGLVWEWSDQWHILSEVTWTRWSRFAELDFEFSEPATEALLGAPVPEKWEDTYRYSLAVNYLSGEELILRLGIAYEETPIPNPRYRSPRIPDADRIWISAGATWQWTEHLSLDLAYAYVRAQDPEVDNDTHTPNQYLRGKFDADVHILALGSLYSF